MSDVSSTDPIVDNDVTDAAATADPFAALLDAGFDAEAADVLEQTAAAAPAVVAAIQTDLRPDQLAQRVALNCLLIDNTGSMAEEVRIGDQTVTVIRMATMAHDRALDTVQGITANEPVDVLTSASWLNPDDCGSTLIYPYVRIERAPRFGTEADPYLSGMTAWYDRYAEMLAATAAQMADLEVHNKTVYGMVGLLTDGFDNDSHQHDIGQLAKAVRGFRRMKTFVPYVIYTGAMPQQGTYEYSDARSLVSGRLSYMGIDDLELRDADLETLVRRIFTEAGFDQKMVFMPGQDPRAIVQAFVTVSKLMVNVSRGQMPQGLTDI